MGTSEILQQQQRLEQTAQLQQKAAMVSAPTLSAREMAERKIRDTYWTNKDLAEGYVQAALRHSGVDF